MAARFAVNSPPVVLETVDEETIIVNLDTGCYYDLNHSGGRVLEALAAGADAAEATSSLAAAYGVDHDDLEDRVRGLVEQLLAEGIIGEIGDDAEPGSPPNGNGNGNGTAQTAPTRAYEHPALGRHTDMQELLLLDPIHEVDGAGWPNRA